MLQTIQSYYFSYFKMYSYGLQESSYGAIKYQILFVLFFVPITHPYFSPTPNLKNYLVNKWIKSLNYKCPNWP